MTFKERLLLAVAVKKPWQRYAYTCLALLALVLFWWFFSYKSLYHELRRAKLPAPVVMQPVPVAKFATTPTGKPLLAADSRVSHPLVLPCPPKPYAKAGSAVEGLSGENNSSVLPENFFAIQGMSAVVQKIVKLSQDNNLIMSKFNVANTQQLAWATQTQVSVVMTGDFFNMIKFLEALQPFTNIIVERCEMQIVSEAELSCALELSIYTAHPK